MEDLNPNNSSLEKRKSLGFFPTMAQPGKLLLIFAIIVIVLMFGAVTFLIYAKTAPEDSFSVRFFNAIGISFTSKDEKDLENNEVESNSNEEEENVEDENDEVVENEDESNEDEDVSNIDNIGRMMVYTLDDKLMLINGDENDGTSVQIDTLESAYEDSSSLFIPNSYPRFSPDGTKILYTSGLDLKVYDLDTGAVSVLYTAHEPDFDSGNYYVALSRACWKDDDEVFFVHDLITDNAADMDSTYYVKLLNIDTSAISNWGSFNTDTGFGGSSDNPSEWLRWHFSDLIGVNREMYWDGTSVYVNTYLDNVTWVSVPNGGTGSIVSDDVVLPLTDYEHLGMDLFGPTDSSVLMKDGVAIYSDADAYAFGNLLDDSDNGYIYFTKIEYSQNHSDALDAQDPTPESEYPNTFIMRYNIDSDTVETVTEGLSFDLY